MLAARCSRRATKVLAMLKRGLNVREVIAHRLPVADYKTGFGIMQGGNSGTLF